MPIALTSIKHGNPDGSVVWVEAGEDIAELPDEVVDSLRASGAIGDEFSAADADKVAALEAEIEDLRAQVRAARGDEVPLSPGVAAQTIMGQNAVDTGQVEGSDLPPLVDTEADEEPTV